MRSLMRPPGSDANRRRPASLIARGDGDDFRTRMPQQDLDQFAGGVAGAARMAIWSFVRSPWSVAIEIYHTRRVFFPLYTYPHDLTTTTTTDHGRMQTIHEAARQSREGASRRSIWSSNVSPPSTAGRSTFTPGCLSIASMRWRKRNASPTNWRRVNIAARARIPIGVKDIYRRLRWPTASAPSVAEQHRPPGRPVVASLRTPAQSSWADGDDAIRPASIPPVRGPVETRPIRRAAPRAVRRGVATGMCLGALGLADGRLDHAAGFLLRHRGVQADVWSPAARRDHAAGGFDGSSGANGGITSWTWLLMLRAMVRPWNTLRKTTRRGQRLRQVGRASGGCVSSLRSARRRLSVT